jgi:hypothetical protein
MFLSQSPLLPDPHLLTEVFQRKRYERIKQKEEQGFVRQWFLLCGPAAQAARLNPQPATLQKLLPPKDRVWADPFLWKRGDDVFIFCEEWIYRRPHGHISVMQLARDGSTVSLPTPVLTADHHLSYPFLFEWEGALHMMPEAGAGRSLDVFRCEEFPHRWRKRATLMRNLRYADATLIQYQGKWWLFITLKRGLFALSRDLFVFSADNPLAAEWTPHPANPVVRSFSSARPAGPLFELNGRLFRPSQDCLIRYGHSLRINEITQLDATHYEEHTVTKVGPDWEAGIRAVHHVDWRADMLVMDTQRLLPAGEIPTS